MNKYILQKGSSTIEILIAFVILIIAMTAVISVTFGSQTNSLDTETNNEALYQAQKILEEARAQSKNDYLSVVSKTLASTTDFIYKTELFIEDLTQCKKQATSTTSWFVSPTRLEKIELTTYFTDIPGFFALGQDCATEPPSKKWDDPQRFASDSLNPGKTTSIDVLGKIAYLGANKKPFIYIADTRAVVFGQNSGMLVGINSNKYTNLFNDDGKTIDQVNDIDVYKHSSGQIYALIAMASSTAQFAVLNVTDMHNPFLVAKKSLNGVDPDGSEPEGYRIYYESDKAYMLTRETLGPELHIFDLLDPSNPLEVGSKELNTTVNDFVINNNLAYFADESDTRGELLIYDVTNPANINEVIGARTNLPGNQNGSSLYLIGNKLYFGRENVTGGPELYIFDASNPRLVSGGLPIIGNPKEVGASVLGIRIAGRFGFIIRDSSSEEVQILNIYDPANISLIKGYNFGNIISGGIDYEPDFLYTTGDATPNFQILYSPT